MKEKKQVTPKKFYSFAFKRSVVLEYDNGQISKRALWMKHKISAGALENWLRKYSILEEKNKMVKKHSNEPKHKIRRLEKRIEELESMLSIDDVAWELIEEETGDPNLRKKYLPELLLKEMRELKNKSSNK